MRDIEAMAHDAIDEYVDASPAFFPGILKPVSKSVFNPLPLPPTGYQPVCYQWQGR